MLQPRWVKVWRDLWANKVRSLLVIASITLGVLVVGMGIALASLVGEDLKYSYDSTHPSHAWIYCSPYEEDVLDSIRRLPQVAGAEGRWSFGAQLRVGPDEWVPLQVSAVPEYVDRSMDLFVSDSGDWPPQDRKLYIERGSLTLSGAQLGDTVEVKLDDETIREMPVGGAIYEDMANPGTALGLYGYVTMDTLPWLHQPQWLNRLNIRVADHADDKAHIEAVAEAVKEQLTRNGQTVYWVYVPKPGERPGASEILGVIQILNVLGLLAVLLGAFLVFSTLSAMLSQHVKHIGIMKAVGARTRQIVGMYVVLILIYGTIALAIAVPAGIWLAHGTAVSLGKQFHFNSLPFRMVPFAIILQLILGLGIPLAAGMIPVRSGTRITVREALSDYGLSSSVSRSFVDRLVEKVRGLSRPLLISLRNTFRHKGRLAMTLITLTLGGAIFISVFALQASMVDFIAQFSKYFLADVNVDFNRFYRIGEVEEYVNTVPGVASVEGWTALSGDLVGQDGTASETVQVLAPPVDSALIEPILLRGRWLVPGDENAIALNNAFWRVSPDLDVGDEIVLRVDERDTTWRVVGFFQFPGDQQLIGYGTYDYVSELVHQPQRSAMFRIVGAGGVPGYEKDLARRVEAQLKQAGFDVGSVQTGRALLEANGQVINSIIAFFLMMAIAIACVGGIGLMGTMTMNVLERTREVGVMRAVGARDRAILTIIIVEGMLIGVMSWCLAALVAIPISRLLVKVMWRAIFQAEATKVTLSPAGFLIWLLVVLGVSAVASFLPARNASRLTVREVLSYQ